jgi:hypothetical protein
MRASLEDASGSQAYNLLLTREQHRRLRLVCTTIGVPMSVFIRRLVSRDVDRRFVRLGLDRVPIVPGSAGKAPGGQKAAGKARDRPRRAS